MTRRPQNRPGTGHAGAPSRRGRGFQRTGSVLGPRIRTASEGRGFGAAKLTAHWVEIVGEEVASRARPVKLGYSGKGLGATLTLLTTGPHAPVIEMQRERIRERVNQAIGHGAVARVRVTQTAPEGFAEGRAVFEPAPPPEAPRADPAAAEAAREAASEVGDERLRAALEALGRNVMTARPED